MRVLVMYGRLDCIAVVVAYAIEIEHFEQRVHIKTF